MSIATMSLILENDRLTARVAELEASRDSAIEFAQLLRTRLEAATEALRPFAEYAERLVSYKNYYEIRGTDLIAGDFFVAAKALRQLEAPHDKA